MPRRHLRMTGAADCSLGAALRALRTELDLPAGFPAEAMAEAEAAVRDPDLSAHEDATDLPFLTIDPPASTDLDQAMHLERRRDGRGYRVHYAIADVAAFVRPGGALDAEAHRRVTTLYFPDGRVPLHPTVLSEGAASLLPGATRPAALWRIDLDSDGRAVATDVTRALVRSRAKLDYAGVQRQIDAGTAEEPLALLRDIGRLREEQERDRGGISLNVPEQEITEHDGSYGLAYRAPLPAEAWNAQVSLLTGIAAAQQPDVVVVPNGPGGDSDERGDLSDTHAASRNPDAAARSSAVPPPSARCTVVPRSGEEIPSHGRPGHPLPHAGNRPRKGRAMPAGEHEQLTQAGILLEGFLSLGIPEGFRAELIDGEIAVKPLPDGDHEECVNVVLKQVLRKSRTDMDFSGNKGLELPRGEGSPRNHAVPDGTFAPTARRLFRGADPWMPCEGIALVVEVTSTKPQADREAKRRCYARGGIPLYLLIDRDESSVTLFSDPEDADYRQHLTIPYGKPLPLPEPFAFDLETGDFG